jgi:hypothetical protein
LFIFWPKSALKSKHLFKREDFQESSFISLTKNPLCLIWTSFFTSRLLDLLLKTTLLLVFVNNGFFGWGVEDYECEIWLLFVFLKWGTKIWVFWWCGFVSVFILSSLMERETGVSVVTLWMILVLFVLPLSRISANMEGSYMFIFSY